MICCSILILWLIPTADVIIRVFSDASGVLEHGYVTFLGCHLSVSWTTVELKESQEQLADRRKVKVSGLPSNMDGDMLTLLLESRRVSKGGEVDNIDLDESSASAIVTFREHDSEYIYLIHNLFTTTQDIHR